MSSHCLIISDQGKQRTEQPKEFQNTTISSMACGATSHLTCPPFFHIGNGHSPQLRLLVSYPTASFIITFCYLANYYYY